MKRPELYIFDDSFSSLDTATDARLRQALRQHTAGATLVIIAQRVSSIVDADQILVLDGGRIVAHGTHAELLETSETYQRDRELPARGGGGGMSKAESRPHRRRRRRRAGPAAPAHRDAPPSNAFPARAAARAAAGRSPG